MRVWSPWTLKTEGPDGTVLLGPKLQIRRLNRLPTAEELASETCVSLVRSGFVIGDNAPPSPLPRSPEGSTGLLIADKHHSIAAEVATILDRHDPDRRWSWLALDDPRVQSWRGEVLVPLFAREPRRHLVRTVSNLLARGAVVWSGESFEGTHIGPVFRTRRQASAYRRATAAWSFARRLGSLGFADSWPNASALCEPSEVADAILEVLSLPSGRAVIVGDEPGRRALWDAAASPGQDEAAFLAEQTWTFGLFARLRVAPSPWFPAVHIGECLSPSGGDPYLESNSGKGLTQARARIGTIGEAVERTAAREANGLVPVRLRDALPRLELDEFHPFGRPWTDYLSSARRPPPFVRAEAVGGGFVAVPLPLVPFPYLPTAGSPQYTSGDTTGLACHSDKSIAIVRAGLELLERHNLYENLLHERPGVRLGRAYLSRLATPSAELVQSLSDAGTLWMLVYSSDGLAAPIVHAFWRPESGAYVARGTGSGLNIEEATTGALTELVQLDVQFRRGVPSGNGQGFIDWSSISAVEYIAAYLERQPLAERLPELVEGLGRQDPAAEVGSLLEAYGSRLLVVTLPCRVPGWSVVRALAPGLAVVPEASASKGGARLIGSTFPFAIPI